MSHLKTALLIWGWIALVACLFLNLNPLFAWSHHLELLAHFRIQAALGTLILPLFFLALKARLELLLALLLCCWNLFEICPWVWPQTPPQAQGQQLKILMSNMLYSNTQTQALGQLIQSSQPDLIILEELHPEHVRFMQSLQASYPYSLHDTFQPAFGLGLWSKVPLEQIEEVFLGPGDLPQHAPKGAPSIYARLKLGRQPLDVLAVHPYPPISAVSFDLRNRQYKAFSQFLSSKSGSKILIGDLNTTPWSPYYRQLERDTGLRNARLGFGLQTSWPNFMPYLLRIPIDHALVSSDLKILHFQAGPDLGSDHLPIALTISR